MVISVDVWSSFEQEIAMFRNAAATENRLRSFLTPIAIADIVGAALTAIIHDANHRAVKCQLGRFLDLDNSRSDILRQSSTPPTVRCAGYRSHIELLQREKKCARMRALRSSPLRSLLSSG
jgi:hypothetical protein